MCTFVCVRACVWVCFFVHKPLDSFKCVCPHVCVRLSFAQSQAACLFVGSEFNLNLSIKFKPTRTCLNRHTIKKGRIKRQKHEFMNKNCELWTLNDSFIHQAIYVLWLFPLVQRQNKAKNVTSLAHAKISTNFAKHTLIGCGWEGQRGAGVEGATSVSLSC